MDRLTTMDTLMLLLDGDDGDPTGSPSGQYGIFGVFQGDAPAAEQLAAKLGAAPERIPRLRHRVLEVPLGLLRPHWIDDDRFDLSYHVGVATRRPGEGAYEAIRRLLPELTTPRLDRTR